MTPLTKYWVIKYYLSHIEPTEFAKNKDLYTQVIQAADVEAMVKPMIPMLEDYILTLQMLLLGPVEEMKKGEARARLCEAKCLLDQLKGTP
jgi:hypothetical protein